jgi:hypothetical protein
MIGCEPYLGYWNRLNVLKTKYRLSSIHIFLRLVLLAENINHVFLSSKNHRSLYLFLRFLTNTSNDAFLQYSSSWNTFKQPSNQCPFLHSNSIPLSFDTLSSILSSNYNHTIGIHYYINPTVLYLQTGFVHLILRPPDEEHSCDTDLLGCSASEHIVRPPTIVFLITGITWVFTGCTFAIGDLEQRNLRPGISFHCLSEVWMLVCISVVKIGSYISDKW